MAMRAAISVVLAGVLAMAGCDGGSSIVGGSAVHSTDPIEVTPSPSLYRAPNGSDSQPWELVGMNGATVMVEPTPPMDPVLAFPSNHLWREFWFPIENAQRDSMEAPALVRSMVDARPGMRIADVGAGGGYFSFRFARDVGEAGHVWSVDVDGRATSKIAWEAHARGMNNITALRVRRGALGLEDLSLDVVAMLETGALNTCEPGDKVRYLEQIAMALREGGRFVYHEVISDSDNPDISGDARGCRTPHADEVIAMAEPFFEVVRREEVSTGDSWRAYILMFRRR